MTGDPGAAHMLALDGAVTEEESRIGAPPWIDAGGGRSVVAIAADVVLLVSRLPEVVAREVLAQDVPWMGWAIVAATIVLWLIARALPVLRPLERFLAVMILVNGLIALLPTVLESAAWQALVPADSAPM